MGKVKRSAQPRRKKDRLTPIIQQHAKKAADKLVQPDPQKEFDAQYRLGVQEQILIVINEFLAENAAEICKRAEANIKALMQSV